MDGAFKMAAFTDDWNNLRQTIADSLQSNSRTGSRLTENSSFFPFFPMNALNERKKSQTAETAPAAVAVAQQTSHIIPSTAAI